MTVSFKTSNLPTPPKLPRLRRPGKLQDLMFGVCLPSVVLTEEGCLSFVSKGGG